MRQDSAEDAANVASKLASYVLGNNQQRLKENGGEPEQLKALDEA